MVSVCLFLIPFFIVICQNDAIESKLNEYCLIIRILLYKYSHTERDGIIVFAGDKSAVNPAHCGTKCAAHYVLTLDPGQEFTIKVRLYFELEAPKTEVFGPDFDDVFQDRQKEADMFYDEVWKNSILDSF